MGGDGISLNCTVDSNICYENGRSGGAAINLASVRSSTISNNVIYNNYAGGIAAWDDGQGIQWGCKNLNILNNTIYFRSGEGRWAVSLKNGSSNAVILNNILLGGSKGGFEFTDDSRSGLNINYNIYFSSGSNHVAMNDSQGKSWNLNEWKALGYDLSSIWAEHSSIMINIITGDPHLKPGSSAIDRGTAVQLFTDYEGDQRPQGAGFDIGADEKK
jgi:parallel beta-helix repeat protein